MSESLIVCRAKVLGIRVTELKRRYWASLYVDADILAAASVHDYEKVLVVNIDNGQRFETYVRSAPAGSRSSVLAGGAAALGERGDEIGFLVFAVVPKDCLADWQPKVVVLNPDNTIRSVTTGDPPEEG